tara:strand:- start:52 stop:234 length:183 start_codon:yes stop_codon:yes gene_type:complete
MANYWVTINASGSHELEWKIQDLFYSEEWETGKGFMISEVCHCDHEREEWCKTCESMLDD